MKRTAYLSTLALFANLLFSPLLHAQGPLPHLIFHAELSGSEQIPAVATAAKGLITIIYSPDRSKVTVTGLMVDLEGDITAVDLHIGKTGETGAFLVSLMPTVHGRRLQGEVEVPAALLHNLLPDRAYASVSTNANPGGEIRGQFICETDLDFAGVLTGSQAVPSNNSPAIAFGGAHFPTGSEDLVYSFIVQGLSSAATEIGIYEGDPGQNGTLVHAFSNISGGFIQGLIELGSLTPQFFRDAREGKFYYAIKTVNYPDGEIRGPVDFLGYFTSFAPVNAVQVFPNAGASAGFAFSHNRLNATLDSLSTTVFVRGLTPTSVDIYSGAPGTIGVKIETLTPAATPGMYHKTYPLDTDRLSDFAKGHLYVNVPTDLRPNGEIRGQMKNSLRKGYAYDLCGQQVVPPTTSPAYGVAMSSVDQADCYLNYKVIYDKLSSPIKETYVCQAYATMNGNAIYPMPATTPLIVGYQEIENAHGVAIELGETYVLIVSDSFPNGEIRGQIVRGINCPPASSVRTLSHISQVMVSPMPFNDELRISFDSHEAFDGQLVIYDILGVRTLVQAVQITPGLQQLTIPTNALTPGYYNLALEAKGQGARMLLKKLIKG
jgi:hypothetical protein